MAASGGQVLLPICPNMSKSELTGSPSLADRLARSTNTHTVDEIAEAVRLPKAALPRIS